jgi:hypothetical protein
MTFLHFIIRRTKIRALRELGVSFTQLFLRRINRTCSARYAIASPFVAATAAMDVHAEKPDASSNHATAKPRTESEQATEW